MIELHLGDCLEVMKGMPENSVDTCITDPPYELGFMGKKWDNTGVAFQPETWAAVYRVLKPGAILLAFGGTRTYHRMACAIEDAGFEIRDTIAWVYGSGFPKSYDISKGIDKQAGAQREIVGHYENPDGHIRTSKQGYKKEYVGGSIEDSDRYLDGDLGRHITAPSTPEAQLWDGWGTALKPAMELICVAMKPIDGTFVNNALTWGVAGLWIDGGRVEFVNEADKGDPKRFQKTDGGVFLASDPANTEVGKNGGRFPANVITDGSDEVTGLFPNDAQRFFYCAKASRSERNAGLEGMEEVDATDMTGRKDGSAGLLRVRADGSIGENPYAGKSANAKNHHPTVKPLALMRYLARLTKTPTGGVVLDPFMGSGTTGIACLLEGREFIGIEREPDYMEIARRRIEHWAQQQPMLI